ncbi:MAG: tail fiber domain-containing protein [Candidatus Acidiferrales bacterium]
MVIDGNELDTNEGLFLNHNAAVNVIIADGGGNVMIGTSGVVAERLRVSGDIRIGTGTTGCVKDNDADILTGTCSSDARLKRDIEPFPPMLERVVQLTPVHFYWRAAEYPERTLGTSRSYGLVAQDVEQVMPELVTQDQEGFKAVRYSQLPLLMLQALKELKAENDHLRKELESQLSAQAVALAALRAELEEIQQVLAQVGSEVRGTRARR